MRTPIYLFFLAFGVGADQPKAAPQPQQQQQLQQQEKAYEATTETPPKGESHMEVKTEYESKPAAPSPQPTPQLPAMPQPMNPYMPPYVPPPAGQAPAYYPPPYYPYVPQPILSATYAPPNLKAEQVTEKIQLGMPYLPKPSYEVNLIDYRHAYPKYTTTTTTTTYATTTTPKKTTPYTGPDRARFYRTSKATPTLYTSTTTPYTTTTVTTEKAPSPEPRMEVKANYGEVKATQRPNVTPPTPKPMTADTPKDVTTTTTQYTTTTQAPYFAPAYTPLLSMAYVPEPFRPAEYKPQAIQQGMPYSRPNIYEPKEMAYAHSYPVYTAGRYPYPQPVKQQIPSLDGLHPTL